MMLSVFYDHILQAVSQTGKPLAELLQGVRTAGIEAVEINMTYLCEHEETYALLQEANLRVSCVYEFYEMEQKEEKAQKHIDTARKAGADKILVVPGFLSDEEAKVMKECVSDYDKMAAFLDKNEKALRMLEGLSEIAAWGKNAGILVTVEDFDDSKSPISSVNGLKWFLSHISDLKVTFDTGNFIIHDESVLGAWEILKERVVHVHCKDRKNEPVVVGNGYIPMKAVLYKMKEYGYNGYFAIEHFDAADQEKCMKNSAEFLYSVLEHYEKKLI